MEETRNSNYLGMYRTLSATKKPTLKKRLLAGMNGIPGTTSPPKLPCAPISETHNSGGQINLGLIPLPSAFSRLFHFQLLIEGMNKLDQCKPFD